MPSVHHLALALALWLAAWAHARAGAAVTIAPTLDPGSVFAVTISRERSVDDDGHWLLEAKSQTSARLRVLARDADGWRLSWSVGGIVQEVVPGEPSEVARRLGAITVGLAFEATTDAAGRPLAIRERSGVREWLRASTNRTVEAIESDLVGQGYPREQIGQLGEAMRRPFLELADAPDARFDQVYLRDLRLILELAGRDFEPGVELVREANGPVPMIMDREPRLSVHEHAYWSAGHDGARSFVVERTETLAEEIAARDVLARFPGLLAVIARLEPERQQQALDELPPASFERRTMWQLDPQRWLPVRIELEERVTLGGLGRKTTAVYDLRQADG